MRRSVQGGSRIYIGKVQLLSQIHTKRGKVRASLCVVNLYLGIRKCRKEHHERQSLKLNGTRMRAIQTSKPSNKKDTLDHICLKDSKEELLP